MENLKIYEKYKEVPQNALRAFDNGKFKGTDINTMWRIKSLTEEFGPCGFGWYPEIIKLWSEPGTDNELLCFAEIKLYIKINNEWSKGISATGGSKIVEYYSSKKYNKSNDEGYKMAVTDALGVACKMLGFGAAVYWSNDKTKYDFKDNLKETKKQNSKEEQLLPPVEECEVNFETPKRTAKETIISIIKTNPEESEHIRDILKTDFNGKLSKDLTEEEAKIILDRI